MFDLTGKTALVTGATGTIGDSIARTLHAQGATVAISGTRTEILDQLAAQLGGRVHVLPCNLADAAAVDALVTRAEEVMGQLDILVANAGDMPASSSRRRSNSGRSCFRRRCRRSLSASDSG